MKINRCLIIDTETSGLTDDAEVIEIGLVLYSVTNQCTMQEFSTLLPATKNEAENVNRIKTGALAEMSLVGNAHTLLIANMIRVADAFIAHNSEFDRPRFVRWYTGQSAEDPYPSKPWLCTMADFKWPLATREQGSLINLALDHGIGVASAHRALTDCRLIASLFDRMDDLPAMFEVAMRPKGLFQALVSYDDRLLAKEKGFKWNGADKSWTRMMALEDAAQLSFRTRRLDAATV